MENNITNYVAILQLIVLGIGVLSIVLRVGKRDAAIDRSIDELLVLKDITKDLVKTDIEQGKSIITIYGELKELRHRIEVLERKTL